MNISTKQKQTHKYREQTCGCQGGEGQGGKDWEFGMNCIQYPVINHNGKEYKKVYIYMYN